VDKSDVLLSDHRAVGTRVIEAHESRVIPNAGDIDRALLHHGPLPAKVLVVSDENGLSRPHARIALAVRSGLRPSPEYAETLLAQFPDAGFPVASNHVCSESPAFVCVFDTESDFGRDVCLVCGCTDGYARASAAAWREFAASREEDQ